MTVEKASDEIVIQKALEIDDLDHLKLAKLNGFSKKEIDMVKLFWEQDMDNGWFYIGKKMVIEWLGEPDSKDTMYNFYKNNLIKNYEENEEYQEVDKNNDIIKKFYSSNLTNQKPGNRAKYYIITGDCLKSLLMSANTAIGKEIRKYFIKVEKIAKLMTKIFSRKQDLAVQIKDKLLLQSQEKIKKIEEGKLWIHKATKENVHFNEFVKKTDGMYIGSCLADHENGIEKIGKAIDNKEREKTLAASSTTENAYTMDASFEIFEGLERATEQYVHALFAPFHVNARKSANHRGSTELFMLHRNFAKRIIMKTINEQNNTVELINEYTRFLKEHDFNIPSIDYTYNNAVQEHIEQPTQLQIEDVPTISIEEIDKNTVCNVCVHECDDDSEDCDCECKCNESSSEYESDEDSCEFCNKDLDECRCKEPSSSKDTTSISKVSKINDNNEKKLMCVSSFGHHRTNASNFRITKAGRRANDCKDCDQKRVDTFVSDVIFNLDSTYVSNLDIDNKMLVIKNELDLIIYEDLVRKQYINETIDYKRCGHITNHPIELDKWMLKSEFSPLSNGSFDAYCRPCRNEVKRENTKKNKSNGKKSM